MDETIAETSPSLAVALGRDLGAMFAVAATIPDGALRRRPDRAVGDSMGAVARGLDSPIERRHPAPRPAP